VFSAVFHPKHELIVFYCEDKTVYESYICTSIIVLNGFPWHYIFVKVGIRS
jgi:hypothetical protein